MKTEGDTAGGHHDPGGENRGGVVEEDGREGFPKRATAILGVIAMGLTSLLALALCLTSFTSFDGPLLVKFGELLISNGEFPRFSDYSAVHDADSNFAYHKQWLAEILFYLAYSLFGLVGFWCIKFSVLAAMGAGFTRAFFGKTPLWILAGILALMFFALVPRILLRGDFLSLALFTLMVCILAGAGRDRSWKRTYWLIPIVLVWVNIHPLVIVGLGFFSLFVLEEVGRVLLFERENLKPSLWGSRHLWGAFLGCWIAGTITPFGPKVLFSPVSVYLGSVPEEGWSQIQAMTREFKPLSSVFLNEHLRVFQVLVVAACASALINWKRARPWMIGGFLALVFLSFRHIRMAGFGAVASAYVLLENLPGVWSRVRSTLPSVAVKTKRISLFAATLTVAGIGYLLIDAGTGNLYFRTGEMKSVGKLKSNLFYPWKAVEFVDENRLEGNCFNNYDVGSFLAFSLPESNRVFIDTQLFYSYDFYFTYDRISRGEIPLQPLLEKYGVGFALFKHQSRDVAHLLRVFSRDQAWAPVYLDECAVIFLPRTKGNLSAINRFGIEFENCDGKELLSDGSNSDPRAFTALGDFFVKIERPRQAKDLYVEALERNEDLFTAWNNLGVILMKEGRAKGALTCFVKAIRLNSRYDRARKNLKILLGLGKWERGDPDVQEARDMVRD
ncbi:MAG: tetratricopeptide repeat protein [Planctomycetota bacterium]